MRGSVTAFGALANHVVRSNDWESQCSEQAEHHRLLIAQNIVITNPDDMQPRDSLQIVLALAVRVAAIVVTATIELDHQAMRLTVEIDNIRTDAMLTAEFCARKSAITKQSPEDSLGNRCVFPKGTCSCLQCADADLVALGSFIL